MTQVTDRILIVVIAAVIVALFSADDLPPFAHPEFHPPVEQTSYGFILLFTSYYLLFNDCIHLGIN